RHLVPLHLGALDPLGEEAHRARKQAQPGHPRILLRRLVEQLHPDADGQERDVPLGRVGRDLVQARRHQRLHAAPEGAHAGKNDADRALGLVGTGDEHGVGSHLDQRLLGRAQVPYPVVQDGDHSEPLVEGTSAPSTRTASRKARATPLKEASRMWWVLRPLRVRRWRVSPALVAKARQNSSASWGSKGGWPRGPASGASSTSYARKGRPDRSRATSTRASSRGRLMEAKRRTPALSPRAEARASPSTIPTSSTVWWASTFRSPWAFRSRSKPPCLPSWATMWSRNGSPVLTSARPPPSRSRASSMAVSLVRRVRVARRLGVVSSLTPGPGPGRPGRPSSPPGCRPSPVGIRPAGATSCSCG